MSKSDLASLSNNLIDASMAVCALAFLVFAYELAWSIRVGEDKTTLTRGVKALRVAQALTILYFLILLVGVITRGISAGRAPWGNMYEFSITGTLAFTFAYLIASLKFDVQWLGILVSFASLITLGTAVTLLYVPSAPLVPALKSPWLVIHVLAAIISGGVFLLANCIAGAYLVLEQIEKKRAGLRPVWSQRLPKLETLDQLSYRLVALVFPLWTFAIIAGAIWAEAAWGRYWGWDPKETWSFITWVAYAAYLHARVTAGWKGRRAAWLCLIAGSTFLFNYVYVNIWGTGKHTYSGL
jgi:cytochrome c-type biogenesis protein CcsB